jgi:arginine N-succinyltransferase
MSAGFKETDMCDIFDGGPAIECEVSDTLIARTVQKAVDCMALDGEKLIHFGGTLQDFRATFGQGDLTKGHAAKGADAVINSDIYLARVYKDGANAQGDKISMQAQNNAHKGR